MSKFVVKNIDSIKGKQQFKQLVIVDDSVDDKKLQLEIDKKQIAKEDVNINGVPDE